MSVRLSAWSGSCGLGDVLLLTAPCRHRSDIIIELPFSAGRLAPLFDGICEGVELKSNPAKILPFGHGTFLEKKMAAAGVSRSPFLPFVKLTDAEKKVGADWAKQFRNPIACVFNCSPNWKIVREFPEDVFLSNLTKIAGDRDIIQFGVSSNFTDLGVNKVLDLPVRELALRYYGIGEMFSVDTGDRHLSAAVGAKTHVLCPKDGSGYYARDWHYAKDTINYITL